MTGNAVGSGHRLQRRPFRLAQHAELTRTAGDERAAPGGIDDARYGSFEDEARALLQRISHMNSLVWYLRFNVILTVSWQVSHLG